MNIISEKTPRLAKLLFSNYTWDIKTDRKELYLTFDDGPTPETTEFILDRLSIYNAKATFFCIGQNIERHPEIFQKSIEVGHTIGNHTYSHKNGWQTNLKDYLTEVEKCQKTIENYSNIKASPYFRPPYGKITLSQSNTLRKRGYKIVMWDVISFDWQKTIEPERCFEKVKTNSEPGSIIVFHDSLKASKNMKYALPKVLEYFSGEGYIFKPLT